MVSQTGKSPELNIVGPQGVFPRVTLVEPTTSAYVFVAMEVDQRKLPIGYLWESRNKKRAIEGLKAVAVELGRMDQVVDATVFKTLLVPPGKSEILAERPEVPVAKYDLVMLLEVEDIGAAEAILAGPIWAKVRGISDQYSHKTLQLNGTNARRIGAVDHSRDGVFLFNYFFAESLEQNLGIWEYTAGWFMDQTGLDNSVLLLPEEGGDYTVINHCRWDRLRNILPSLIFKKSFKSFVISNFNANDVGPIPILYRLA